MAKRFTDTDKWNKKWYRELGSGLRDVRQFVLDRCNHIGVWEIDLKTVQHFTNQKIDIEDVRAAFRGKIVFIDQETLLIPDFIEFQYGLLKEESRPHQSVIKELKKLNLWEEYLNGFPKSYLTLSDDSPKSCLTLKEQEQDKEQDKEKEKEKEAGFDFEVIYKIYPRKRGKDEGMNRLRSRIKTQEAYDQFFKAAKRYAHECRMEKTEPGKMLHWSSFVGTEERQPWRDYHVEEKPQIQPTLTIAGREEVTEAIDELTEEKRAYNISKARELSQNIGKKLA